MATLRPTIRRGSLAELGLRRSLGRFAATLLASVSLTGCAVGPDFSAPAPPTDQTYLPGPATALGSPGRGEIGQSLSLGGTLQADWWTRLGSPELDRTVALALSNNRTIDIARANLAKAGELVTAARGGLYPQVDAAAGIARRQYGASFLGPLASTFPAFSAYTAGLTVSYDLDIFGGTHRRIELAAADADVQSEALNAARLTVAGDTVIEALLNASIRAQIDVVQMVIASDQQNMALVQAALGAGVATQIDVTTAQSQLDRDRALLPPLHQQLDVTRDALAILVGKSPATWAAPYFDLDKMTLPQDIPLAVPSDLVRARPDIRAAEARLHVANAAVGVATADLYPRVTLSAAIAEEGLTAGPAGAAWSLVGGLAGPIFHGGELSARKRAAQDAYQAALGDYQQTVLAAFQQIADNLHGLANAADAVLTEQQALDSANTALGLTRLGYSVGNAGIIQVLDAQRLQQLAELNLVQARAQRYVVTVNLFVAAGGGIADTSK
jgi:NodT family efflux transporter outer membrane factor (OMF) lipoprotein